MRPPGQGALALGGSALIAGLLIGLGGPFWYRVFGGLSNLATLLRGAGQVWTNPEELSTRPKVRDEADDGLDAEVTRVADAIDAATNPPEAPPASRGQALREGAEGQGAEGQGAEGQGAEGQGAPA